MELFWSCVCDFELFWSLFGVSRGGTLEFGVGDSIVLKFFCGLEFALELFGMCFGFVLGVLTATARVWVVLELSWWVGVVL